MIIVNLVKVAAIWLCDLVNLAYYPFKKATYSTSQELEDIEFDFYQDLHDNFVVNGHFKYQLPMPDDEGDAALFQGIYTAMENFKHETVTVETRAANEALGKFFVHGRLIRGIRSDGTINDTTSNDSASGVLLGLYSIWGKSTGEADVTVREWAHEIIKSGYALTDLAGEPTKYGQLEDGIKTDPLRITLLLGILSLATHCSEGEEQDMLRSHYAELYKKYKLLLRYPKVKLLWYDTDYDTHRAAIHLHVLYNLTGDQVYADGLRRIARITEAENNAWVQTLCWPFNGLEVDMSILQTFSPLQRFGGTMESLNDVPSVMWGGKERSVTALPIYRRGSQEFFWQRNMFSKNEWEGQTWAGARHSGLDFLVCYWLAKRLRLLA